MLRNPFLSFLVLLLLTVQSSFASGGGQISEAKALIDRAENVSSLTGPSAVPFFLELRYERPRTRASGGGGTYKLWWAAHDKWHAQAQSDDVNDIEVRNDQGLWLREEIDPKTYTIFSNVRRFPFGGPLLNWGEQVTGLKDQKVDGKKLPCVQTENSWGERELCFEPQTGVLVRAKLFRAAPRNPYWGDAGPRTEVVTEYRDYTATGDKVLPREMLFSSQGHAIASIRLLQVGLNPLTPFPADTFKVPEGYHAWPGCEFYRPPDVNSDFGRQFTWSMGTGPLPDGVRIVVGADGKAERVDLINRNHKSSKEMEYFFMNQTYRPATCDGKPVVGMFLFDF